MNISYVYDLDDPRLAPYRQLPVSDGSRRRSPPQHFVVEGWVMVERLLGSTCRTESVLLDEARIDEFGSQIPNSTEVLVVPHGMIEQIIGFNFHRGVLGCGVRPIPAALAEIRPRGSDPWTLVVCVEIQDPTNLGTILRNSAAFGAAGVLLSPQCADPWSRRVLRVSMGSVFRLPVVQSNDLAADLASLRDTDAVQLAATVLDDSAEILDNARRPDRLALLFGNEGHGLASCWIQMCQRKLTLPMQHRVDSLNAAVATGIFLYHFTRRALKADC